MRLDKLLAQCGFGSRQQVKQLVRAGAVRFRGEPVRDPGLHVEPGEVTVQGEPLAYRPYLYLMLHKPPGLLTATRDRHAPTVLDLLPGELLRRKPAPVGRLDKDAEGLLLITDDGALAHYLLSPARHVEKVYRVTCDAGFVPADIAAFASGMDLGDFVAKPAQLTPLDPPTEALITVTEGKFHQVKRMCAARGKTVLRLIRLGMGGLTLDPALEPGAWRELTDQEICGLMEAARFHREDA